MNIWKLVAIASVLVLLALTAVWIAHGCDIYTKTSVAVETYDELFDETSTEWVEQFVLGLLPSGTTPKEMCGVLSLGAPFALLLLIAVFKLRRSAAGQT